MGSACGSQMPTFWRIGGTAVFISSCVQHLWAVVVCIRSTHQIPSCSARDCRSIVAHHPYSTTPLLNELCLSSLHTGVQKSLHCARLTSERIVINSWAIMSSRVFEKSTGLHMSWLLFFSNAYKLAGCFIDKRRRTRLRIRPLSALPCSNFRLPYKIPPSRLKCSTQP